MKHIPPYKLGMKLVDTPKGPLDTQRNLGLKTFQKVA
jgi:hypothetical protein